MRHLVATGLAALLLVGCSSPTPPPAQASAEPAQSAPTNTPLGSPAWCAWVGRSLGITDDGHGPDPGSDEWNQAVQRKLGQEAPEAAPGSPQWQQAVDALLRTRGAPQADG